MNSIQLCVSKHSPECQGFARKWSSSGPKYCPTGVFAVPRLLSFLWFHCLKSDPKNNNLTHYTSINKSAIVSCLHSKAFLGTFFISC